MWDMHHRIQATRDSTQAEFQESLYGISHDGISQCWKNGDCMDDVAAALGWQWARLCDCREAKADPYDLVTEGCGASKRKYIYEHDNCPWLRARIRT